MFLKDVVAIGYKKLPFIYPILVLFNFGKESLRSLSMH